MDKKTLIEAFTLKIEGHTYQAIGEKFGFSKQHIEQELKNAIGIKSSYLQKYPQRKAIVKYLSDNNLSINEFSNLIDIPYSNLLTFFGSKSQSLKIAIKIADYTGLSLDDVFGRQTND